jgi:5-methylcytosine-specific restriction protein A
MPSEQEFRDELHAQLRRAHERAAPHYELNAGELHRTVGGYPGENHQIELCCHVMRAEMGPGDSIVLHPEDKESGAALTVRYLLPRTI